ncbi:MAG: cell division protein ZapB [Gammaproteobacteria bacterium]|nr:cell division protein ZapB [Gammaproteobacteria bacterium]
MVEMSEEKFDTLNEKVDDLIQLCTQMKRENQALKASENSLQADRKQLLEKNKETKTKLESILVRLKAINYS